MTPAPMNQPVNKWPFRIPPKEQQPFFPILPPYAPEFN